MEGSPEFEAYTPDNTVEPGEDTSIAVTLENQGSIDTDGEDAEEQAVTEARDVTAELGTGDAPISVSTAETRVGTVPQGLTTTESFGITVDGDATPGTYEVPVELTYTYTPEVDGDDEADEITTTETVTTEIVVEESSQFAIEGATSDVNVGSSTESQIDITNTGPEDASEAVVTLEAPDTGLDITSQSTDIYIGDWAAGETEAIDFVAELDEDALPQDYTIYATVEYLDENGNEQTSRQLRTGIPTSEGQEFSVDGVDSELWVGEDGQMTGEITNDGPNTAENVVVTLGDGGGGGDGQLGGILSGIGGGDSSVGLSENINPRETQYTVGTLESGESASFEFPLAVSSEAEAGTQTVQLNTRYRNPGGDVQTADPIDATIDVEGEREIFALEAGTSADGNETLGNATFDPGTTDTLEIRVTNDYDQTLTNVRAQTFVDDPLAIADGEAFVPEIEPGETEVLRFDLEVTDGADPQTYPVEMDFQYDDEENSGQLSSTYRVPVTVNEPADDGLPWLLVVVGLVVVLLALAWWFRDDAREWYNSFDEP
ncbi:COG1361 S-layer family protein [Halalkalicoccus subterraneus]|uniref:COG1361 S-layer family protein n=1 Tax=Halalkalicoccus subterraneus TaxID=2675002 RepID=UPI000EFB1FC4|nr:COG1361 S-layer family protein [Halalkalicoccus subterraneus]